jgi:hypothetical protein
VVLNIEQCADVTKDECSPTVRDVAWQAVDDAYTAAGRDENAPTYLAACAVSDALTEQPFDAAQIVTRLSSGLCLNQHCRLVRDIFGNPFRPVTLDPAWQTGNVRALAQAIYDDRAFERMPILGDALEDAGCDNADVLSHCRQPGEHARGCWVVDLVLAKQ